MAQFTPISALAGGLMIGLAAALLLWLTGRVAGISGILGGLLSKPSGETAWRLAFLAGLLLGPPLVVTLRGSGFALTMQASLPLLLLAGGLVGFGTRLGHGCTSGHGVCGLARGSRRSLVATCTFFAVATATVFVARHLLGA